MKKDTIKCHRKVVVEHPLHDVLDVAARRMPNTQIDVVFCHFIICHRTTLQQQQQLNRFVMIAYTLWFCCILSEQNLMPANTKC